MARTLVVKQTAATAVKNRVIAPHPTVEIHNNGALETSIFDGAVTVRLASGTSYGRLYGTLTKPVVNGVAIFDDLRLDRVGPFELIVECDEDSLNVIPTIWRVKVDDVQNDLDSHGSTAVIIHARRAGDPVGTGCWCRVIEHIDTDTWLVEDMEPPAGESGVSCAEFAAYVANGGSFESAQVFDNEGRTFTKSGLPGYNFFAANASGISTAGALFALNLDAQPPVDLVTEAAFTVRAAGSIRNDSPTGFARRGANFYLEDHPMWREALSGGGVEGGVLVEMLLRPTSDVTANQWPVSAGVLNRQGIQLVVGEWRPGADRAAIYQIAANANRWVHLAFRAGKTTSADGIGSVSPCRFWINGVLVGNGEAQTIPSDASLPIGIGAHQSNAAPFLGDIAQVVVRRCPINDNIDPAATAPWTEWVLKQARRCGVAA